MAVESTEIHSPSHLAFGGSRQPCQGISASKGPVIGHTHGAGKSLTMVMLSRALALDQGIPTYRWST